MQHLPPKERSEFEKELTIQPLLEPPPQAGFSPVEETDSGYTDKMLKETDSDASSNPNFHIYQNSQTGKE